MLASTVKEILNAKGLKESDLVAPVEAWFNRPEGKNPDGTVHSPIPTAAETSRAQLAQMIMPVLAVRGLLDWTDECVEWLAGEYGVV